MGWSASAATSRPAALNPLPQAMHSLSGTARSFSSSRYTNATNFIRFLQADLFEVRLYVQPRVDSASCRSTCEQEDMTMKRNVTLWVVQGLLAALFLFAGSMKLILP